MNDRPIAWCALYLSVGVALSVACGRGGAHPSAAPGSTDAGRTPDANSGGAAEGGGGGDADAASADGGDAAGDDAGADAGGPGEGGAYASDAPSVTNLPVDHVVVIVKEGHTFDNYFGSFLGVEGSAQCTTAQGMIQSPRAPNTAPRDLCHTRSGALADWNGGSMDGWLSVSGASVGNDNLFCAQYDATSIPNYWAYAKRYALGDHFFANVLGPSFPGHLFLLAAQAGWATGNPSASLPNPYWGCDEAKSDTVAVLQGGTCTSSGVFPCFQFPSVPDALPSSVGWRFYGTSPSPLPEIWSMFDAIDRIRNGPLWNRVVSASTFATDILNQQLPAVTWLVDQDLASEHPGAGGVCQGENWTVGFVNQIMQSRYWANTVIFITMASFGGWYDHVSPPRQYGCDARQPYGLGFRLPLLILSPYVKPGVYKTVAEQASIPRFILELFKAPFLSTRDPAAQDGQANDLMDAFDWSQTPLRPLVLQTRACPP